MRINITAEIDIDEIKEKFCTNDANDAINKFLDEIARNTNYTFSPIAWNESDS